MSNNDLIFTSTSGVSSVLTTNTMLETSLTALEVKVYKYADGILVQAVSDAKDYTDKNVLTLVTSALAQVKPQQYPVSGAIIHDFENGADKIRFVIRDEKYINAGDTIALQNANIFTLSEVNKAKVDVKEVCKTSIDNLELRINTSLATAKTSMIDYIDNHDWAISDITGLTDKFTEERNTTNNQIDEVNKSIQDLDVVGCTFETWLNYFARADAYLDELYDTVNEEYYKKMGWIP
jgi:hypothetical protein